MLSYVIFYKDLGVILEFNMKFSSHINTVIKKKSLKCSSTSSWASQL